MNEFELTSTAQIDAMLKAYADKGRLDGICGIWMFPNAFPGTGTILRATVTLPRIIDGYEIKNSKCLTSEFSTICISNRAGDSIELAPEYLFGESNQAGFGVVGSFLDGGGGMTCQPMDYMDIGSAGSGNLSYDYGVSIPANIQVAYVGNAFANWVAQNRVPLILEGIASLGQIVVGAGQVWAGTGAADDKLVAEGLRSGISGASSALGTIAKIMQKASDPSGAHGQAYSQALGVVFDAVGFVVSLRTPSRQVLESIDNFFDVYGYKVCKMKKPNVNTRPFWNYVKCAPGIVNGPMNSNDRTEIENMLTRGVTFWNVTGGAVIGDYSMDNRG